MRGSATTAGCVLRAHAYSQDHINGAHLLHKIILLLRSWMGLTRLLPVESSSTGVVLTVLEGDRGILPVDLNEDSFPANVLPRDKRDARLEQIRRHRCGVLVFVTVATPSASGSCQLQLVLGDGLSRGNLVCLCCKLPAEHSERGFATSFRTERRTPINY